MFNKKSIIIINNMDLSDSCCTWNQRCAYDDVNNCVWLLNWWLSINIILSERTRTTTTTIPNWNPFIAAVKIISSHLISLYYSLKTKNVHRQWASHIIYYYYVYADMTLGNTRVPHSFVIRRHRDRY